MSSRLSAVVSRFPPSLCFGVARRCGKRGGGSRTCRVSLAMLIGAGGLAASGFAQGADPLTAPKVPLVSAVGCATSSGATGWTLTSATEGVVVPTPFTSSKEVDAARAMPLGSRTYTLIGTAEFVSVDELLRHGRRAEFTAKDSVNATGQLRPGHKVLVKGLLIEQDRAQRLNLTSAVGLADACR